eukprot:TRINITY_DN8606_c0_g1_i2.p1 TRINITY_DN8606_c0_g1~~TRINITY_DN8606_c0_g1_i2.p1  ORF type:complete len:723 (+),score=210.61 TRINITY_DN8606_c0_g1_i2:70-2169(+)
MWPAGHAELGADEEGIDSRVVVVVRLRGVTAREEQLCCARFPQRCVRCVTVDGEDSVLVRDPDAPDMAIPGCAARGRRYRFDRVFDERADNDEVYSHTVRPVLGGLLMGYNATCFAYGMTGAGKTYTMMGDGRTRGLCCRAVDDLFPLLEALRRKSGGAVAMHASYLEIYNERIKDLLDRRGEDAPQVEYQIMEDPVRGVTVTNLSEYLVSNLSDLQTLMALGCERRTKASTASNQVSSRSHAILLLHVQHCDEGGCVLTSGKLALIDLAGSERAGPGQWRVGARQQEGANINRSLLALGNCITVLGTAVAPGRVRGHVPYRDSKLTRLLKDSLGGNTRTVMVANCSPSSTCYEETLSTLKYATRASNISRRVTRNTSAVTDTSVAAAPGGGVRRGAHPLVAALSRQVEELQTQLMVSRCVQRGIACRPASAPRFPCARRCTSAGSPPRRSTSCSAGTAGSTQALSCAETATEHAGSGRRGRSRSPFPPFVAAGARAAGPGSVSPPPSEPSPPQRPPLSALAPPAAHCGAAPAIAAASAGLRALDALLVSPPPQSPPPVAPQGGGWHPPPAAGCSPPPSLPCSPCAPPSPSQPPPEPAHSPVAAAAAVHALPPPPGALTAAEWQHVERIIAARSGGDTPLRPAAERLGRCSPAGLWRLGGNAATAAEAAAAAVAAAAQQQEGYPAAPRRRHALSPPAAP